jgi:hypothetical protein
MLKFSDQVVTNTMAVQHRKKKKVRGGQGTYMEAIDVLEVHVFCVVSLVMFRWRMGDAHSRAGATHYKTLSCFTSDNFPFILRKCDIDVSAVWSKKLSPAIWLKVIIGGAILVTEASK